MASPKDLPRDIGGFIHDLRRSAKISLRQLAAQAGVSNPYLSQIERGLRKPSAEVLQQIASALRVSTPAMYLRAGLLDDREGQGVLAAIASDPDLTMAQKQSLSQIYETFRRENARFAEAVGESGGTTPADGPEAAAPDRSEGTFGQPAAASRSTAPRRRGRTPVDPALGPVLESVAVTESGGAPAPTAPAEPTGPVEQAAPAKRTTRKAVRRTVDPATKAADAVEEEK